MEFDQKLLQFTKLKGLPHFLPQPSNIFTQIYLLYLWHFATLMHSTSLLYWYNCWYIMCLSDDWLYAHSIVVQVKRYVGKGRMKKTRWSKSKRQTNIWRCWWYWFSFIQTSHSPHCWGTIDPTSDCCTMRSPALLLSENLTRARFIAHIFTDCWEYLVRDMYIAGH